jgi:hypothetical protein
VKPLLFERLLVSLREFDPSSGFGKMKPLEVLYEHLKQVTTYEAILGKPAFFLSTMAATSGSWRGLSSKALVLFQLYVGLCARPGMRVCSFHRRSLDERDWRVGGKR